MRRPLELELGLDYAELVLCCIKTLHQNVGGSVMSYSDSSSPKILSFNIQLSCDGRRANCRLYLQAFQR